MQNSSKNFYVSKNRMVLVILRLKYRLMDFRRTKISLNLIKGRDIVQLKPVSLKTSHNRFDRFIRYG